MVDTIPGYVAEAKVGVERHASIHYARAVSAEKLIYILHSQRCRDEQPILALCPFSRALDQHGIDLDEWVEDVALPVAVVDGRLVPADHA